MIVPEGPQSTAASGAQNSGAELVRTRSQTEVERAAAAAANEALAAETENTAQMDAELRATQSVLQCAEIDRAIKLMLEANDDVTVVQTAAAVLSKLLGNVVSDPTNAKFRKIKKDNRFRESPRGFDEERKNNHFRDF